MTRIQAFNESTLARHFSKIDFYNDVFLSDEEYRNQIVNDAVQESDQLFSDGINYNTFYIGKKKSFSISELHQKIVFRTCASYLKKSITSTKKSRSQIARELKVFLTDGTPYHIYRLDIKSFFENIQRTQLEENLENLRNLSMHTIKLIKRTMNYFEEKEGICVPRGIEISSILSDLYLQKFDNYILSRSDIFFYTRFVDDILIITSNENEFHNLMFDLNNNLPKHMQFNKEKTKIISVKKRSKSGDLNKGKQVAHFDYLGFRFQVIDSPLPIDKSQTPPKEKKNAATAKFREVKIDLSPNKVKRIKDKICKAFYSYSKTNNYALLKDRIRFLSTNRELIKKDNSTIIPVGIYYNSSACDFPSAQLSHIDSFMRYLLFSKTGRLPKKYSRKLSSSQKRELVKFSFTHGFNNRIHKRFSYNRLSTIVEVWK